MDYDDSLQEEQSLRDVFGTFEDLRLCLENTETVINSYTEIESQARESLLEWEIVADETANDSNDIPVNNTNMRHEEKQLSKKRITLFYNLLAKFRKRVQILSPVHCLRIKRWHK